MCLGNGRHDLRSDRNAGSFPIPIYTHGLKVIASVLADGLSKMLKEPLRVAQADFVEPTKPDLYKLRFSDKKKRDHSWSRRKAEECQFNFDKIGLVS